jgi:transposase
MSVYVGIDVHRKRSQVAVIDDEGKVLANRNVPNGVEPVLSVIGGLPPGTPAAFEAAFGWGWLAGAAGGLRLQPAPGAPAAVQGDRLGQAEKRQGSARRSWRSCCTPTCCRRRGSRRRRCASCGRCCGTGRSWCGCARCCATGSTPSWPTTVTTARPAAAGGGPGRAWLAALELPAVSRVVIEDDLALIDALQQPIDRLDWEVHQRARSEPAVKILTQLPGVGPLTALVILAEVGDISRFGSARKLAAWPGSPPPSAAATARSATATSPSRARRGCGGSWARRRRPPNGIPTSPPATRPSRGAAARRSPPPRSPASCSPAPTTYSPTPRPPHPAPPRPRRARSPTGRGRQAPGELAFSHEPATPRSMT